MSVSTFADRVKDSYTGAPGTGNVTLANSAPTGFRTFDSQFGHAGTHFYYVIDHVSEWEVGEGHLSAAATLVRDTVLASSNAGSLVNFTSGSNEVYADLPASSVTALVKNMSRTVTLQANATNLTETPATVPDLTLNLEAAHWYRILFTLYISPGNAGISVDFAGGSATATDMHGFFNADDLLGDPWPPPVLLTSLSDVVGGGIPDEGVAIGEFVIQVNAGGTLIPRFYAGPGAITPATFEKFSIIQAFDITP